MTRVRASCHCGAVVIQATLSAPPDRARRCTCSFCKRRQAANVSAPLDSLKVLQGHDHLTLYQWGSHTAKHWFCKSCGIYTHHQRRSDPTEIGVNLGCIDGINPADYEPFFWTNGAAM